ncbi:MAG TPA: VOC family protein [Chthoniobacterales bacterium]|nr:VOC family protein [Chthoniobacterales bacterium]
MKVRRIAFACIPVADIKRARAFYEGVLDLEAAEEMMGGEWIEYEAGGDTIAITRANEQFMPSDQGISVALEVEDFDAAILKMKVAVIRFALEPTESPVCHVAVVQDPDGNKIMIHKLKAGR